MTLPKRHASEVMQTALAAGQAIDVSVLAEELLTAFGGPKRFAKRYFREFSRSKEGSISRSKSLEGMLRLMTNASAQNKKAGKDVDVMSDAELADEAERLLLRRGLKVQEAADATPPSDAAA